MATATTVQVPDATALRQTIDSYIVQGFSVAVQDAASATMIKKKEFNVVWAVIGFFACILPLLVYCIVYSAQKDQMVRIIVGAGGTRGVLKLSPDGNWWWSDDRQLWVGVLESLPVGSSISEDRNWWWDGGEWRRLPKPADRDGDGAITTRDASDAPMGLPAPGNSETVERRLGEPLPPPTGL